MSQAASPSDDLTKVMIKGLAAKLTTDEMAQDEIRACASMFGRNTNASLALYQHLREREEDRKSIQDAFVVVLTIQTLPITLPAPEPDYSDSPLAYLNFRRNAGF